MHEARLGWVRDLASRILDECGVTKPDEINLPEICERVAHADIVISRLDGCTARAFWLGERGGRSRIRVSDRIRDPGARLFATGHECGHLVLGHEIPIDGDATAFLERACARKRTKDSDPEREASVFASELLMPERHVKPRCQTSAVTLAPVRDIARECRTSALASAMRFIELTSECCAVVYSEVGRVRWVKRSAKFPGSIARGRRLDPGSAAYDYFTRGAVDDTAQELAADVWLPSHLLDGRRIGLVEHAAAVPEQGGVFSLLWIPAQDLAHLARSTAS